MALKIFILFINLLLISIGVMVYLNNKYRYESLTEFRPEHHILTVLLLFWTNTILYIAVFRAITHFSLFICVLFGYTLGCILHRKDIRETYNIWRLNCNGKEEK